MVPRPARVIALVAVLLAVPLSAAELDAGTSLSFSSLSASLSVDLSGASTAGASAPANATNATNTTTSGATNATTNGTGTTTSATNATTNATSAAPTDAANATSGATNATSAPSDGSGTTTNATSTTSGAANATTSDAGSPASSPAPAPATTPSTGAPSASDSTSSASSAATSTAPAPAATNAPLAPPASYMVGFDGPFPTALVTLLGGDVRAVHPEAGFALVDMRDPSLVAGLVDVLPGLSYVTPDLRTHADATQWDSAQWDSAHWDAATWDGAHWDAATWDAAHWDAATWDAAQWDAAQWDAAHWDASRYASATADPGFGQEWQLGALHAPDAWNRTSAYHAVTICIVDSGVDYTHPDLAPNMKQLGDGTFGRNFVAGTNDPMDDAGHGTAMAGIAAASLGNGHGIAGVSQAWIVAAKVIDANGSGLESNLALGIRWCVDSGGARVISLSLHTDQDNAGVHDAVKYAKGKGAIILAASGNEGKVCDSCVPFPAGYPEALGVGAAAPNGTRAGFSNGGKELSFLAPGVTVPSTWPGGGYIVGSGTSQATASAAGVAALLFSLKPTASTDNVRDAMLKTSTDAGVHGFDTSYGYGMLRADAALALLVPP